jgi:BirA family biotin operon repressor/biotin-[acetyl-CoA-carboxylase] ligase
MSAVDLSDRLMADQLQTELDGTVIGREVVVLEKTTSTNDAILRLATGRAEEGLAVFAEHQTAGRGQRGNRWESPAYKGLWFSLLLRPKIGIAQSVRITTWATQAIANTIASEFSLAATIKSPNDIYLSGRKVAGVLVEMRAQEKAAHLAIVGIGINVNQSREEFPEALQGQAISLAMALHRQVDRPKFALALLRNLDRSYGDLFAP